MASRAAAAAAAAGPHEHLRKHAPSLLLSSLLLLLLPSLALCLDSSEPGLVDVPFSTVPHSLAHRRRLLQAPAGPVLAQRNLVENPSFELHSPAAPPTNWLTRGNVTTVSSPVFDGRQAIQMGFCQICNPNAPNGGRAGLIMGFPAVPKQWYSLYFYVAALGTPGVPQGLQVLVGSFTGGNPGQAVAFNFSVSPGSGSYTVPGGVDVSSSGMFQMASANFQAVDTSMSVAFLANALGLNTFVIDLVTVLPVAEPIQVANGNIISLAQACFMSCPELALLLSGGASVAAPPPSDASPVLQQIVTLGSSALPTGSAFYQQPLSLVTSSGGTAGGTGSCAAYSFTASFAFRIAPDPAVETTAGEAGAVSAPGLVFTLTPDPVQGAGGPMLGYGRVCGASFSAAGAPFSTQDRLCRGSVGVEVDGVRDAGLWDASSNHIGVDANYNTVSLEAVDLGSVATPFAVSDGNWNTVSVLYNASLALLVVRVLPSGATAPSTVLQMPGFDLCTLAASSDVTPDSTRAFAPLYVGFTGSAAQGSVVQLANATLQVLELGTTIPPSNSPAVSTQGNLVMNPSFESWLAISMQPGDSLTAPDEQSLPGWRITLGSVWVLQQPSPSTTCQAAPYEGAAALALGGCPSALCGFYGSPAPGDGAMAACMQASGQGAVQQTVNGTVPGQAYAVSVAVWVPVVGGLSTLTIDVGGISQAVQLAAVSPPPAGVTQQYNYQQVSVQFKASAAATVVTLTGASSSASIVVDSVSVVLVAVPGGSGANGIQPVSSISLSNFSSEAFQTSMNPPVMSRLEIGTVDRQLKAAVGGQASAAGAGVSRVDSAQVSALASGVQGGAGEASSQGMFTAGTAALQGAPNSSSSSSSSSSASSPWVALNTPQPLSTGLALFPKPVSVVTVGTPTDANAAPSCTPLSFAVDFTFQAVAPGGGSGAASASGGLALVLQQGFLPGSPTGTSLGFTRSCVAAGVCGGGLAVGLPGSPSCYNSGSSTGPAGPGAVLLNSLRPPTTPTSAMCNAPTAAGSMPGNTVWGVSVVYDAGQQTVAAWVSQGASGIGANNVSSQAPQLVVKGVDTCRVLMDGRTGDAAASVASSLYLGFSASAGDCGGDASACVAYRVLSMQFTNSVPSVPPIPPSPPGPTFNPFDTQTAPGSPPPPPPSGGGSLPLWIIILAVGAWVIALLIVTGCLILIMRRRAANLAARNQGATKGAAGAAAADVKGGLGSSSGTGTSSSSSSTALASFRRIPISEIHRATRGFHVSRQIGVPGAYGTMFKGSSTLGQQWAVKRYKMGSGVYPGCFAGFEDEVTRLSKANPKGVVPLAGYFSLNDPPEYIAVYQLETQESLFEALHKRKDPVLTMEQRLRIVVGLAEALAGLHSCAPPLVHRNVKPSNILLTTDGTPKLADFCFARSLGQPAKEGEDKAGEGVTAGGGSSAADRGTVLSPVREESGPLAPSASLRKGGSGSEIEPLTGARSESGRDVGTGGGASGTTVLDVMEIIADPAGGGSAEDGARDAAAATGRRPPFVPRRVQREGYIDPEVVSGASSSSSPKSDVFSFGVVVLELLTGRLAVMPDPDDPQTNLIITDWAVHYIQSGEVHLIADPRIFTATLTEPILKLGQIAVECVRMPSDQRPDMVSVSKLLSDICSKHFDNFSKPALASETPVEIVSDR